MTTAVHKWGQGWFGRVSARIWGYSLPTIEETYPTPTPASSSFADAAGDFDCEIEIADSLFRVKFTGSDRCVLMQAGKPLQDVGEGWKFKFLYSGFAPVLLFELEHSSGARGTWYFDCTGNFLGHLIENLPLPHRSILLQKAASLLSDAIAPLAGSRATKRGKAVAEFFEISEFARQQICAACAPMLLPAAKMVTLAEWPQFYLTGSGVIVRDHLAATLNGDFQARLIVAAREGHLSMPSPIDGTAQPCTGALCLDFFSFCYRMQDEASNLTFFVIVSEHVASILGVYFPAEGYFVVKDEPYRRRASMALPRPDLAIVDFMGRFGATMLPYLMRHGLKRVAATMRENHLGHQLWNELSGLHALVVACAPHELPPILPLRAAETAFFGEIDELFPELKGKLHSSLRLEPEIIDYANRQNLMLARFTGNFVSAGLRQRIVGLARETESFHAIAATCRSFAGPVVIVGLRVENRTAVDLPGFVLRLGKCLASAVPGVTIVLDGQNASGAKVSEQASVSFSSHLAIRSPLSTELELCQVVKTELEKNGIRVEIASSKPLPISIAWALQADCFISFWGAGLTKYRWVANKPGLVLSNRHNLLHRDDLLIYSSPHYMEAPASLQFADPLAIHDDPSSDQLIPQNHPSFFNFHVNEEIFFPQVSAFVAPFASSAHRGLT